MHACLLESGSIFVAKSVKMHDMFRDMALRITNKRFVFLETTELMSAKSNIHDWNEDVEKMSLWGMQWEKEKMTWYNSEEGNSSQRNQEKLTLTREFPKLSTFLFKLSPKVSLLGLFDLIPKVRVLDMSKCTNVRHLPDVISNLENLQYLDLSETRIKRLPKEMKSLSKLRYLLMNTMLNLEECPAESFLVSQICWFSACITIHQFPKNF